MATMTVTITNVPTFAVVDAGYQFTGTMNLPQTVQAPIRINSMSLYYGRGRTYRVGPYLRVNCGDTTFRTDYFTISETGTSSAKERTLNIIGAITVGNDHLLKVNGRTITFTASHDTSDGKLIDRPYAGDMLLTINYDVLFSKSDFDLSSDSIDMGTDLVVDVTPNELNAAYTHTAVLALGSLSVSAAKTGPGDIVINIPRTSEWLAALPNSVTEKASLTLTTEGDGQVASVTKYINVLVPGDVAPHFDSLSLARIDGRVPAEWNAFIKGESAALLEIVGAVPGVGASIASYRIEGGGYASNLESLQTGKLTVAGEIVFTATVTDSRGRMDQKTVSILVEDYALPFLTEFDAWRTDESGVVLDTGTQIRLRAAYGVSAVHGNTPSFSIFVGSDQVAPTDENSDGSMYTATLAGPWPANRGAEVVVEIRDAVTADSETPASLSFRIPSANVPVHVLQSGGDFGVAFGMYQESTERLSIPESWRFIRGEVDIERKADEAKQAASEASEAVGGKLGKNDTAADSLKLGGVAASEYALKSELGASGVVLETLWTNKSPTSTFAAQTIALDLTDCAAVLITARRSTSLASEASFLYPADGVQRFLSVPGNTINYRYVTVNPDGVVFGEGRWYSSYQASGSTTDNGNVLPQAIYGLKGVRT